ncbi:hypothetical protein OEB99_05265 [Actinotalea sp. M2MS4P-6]|uniref:hypothetical protein n=1 Tax=Actinotalea sp. M2MS4P-6 TaxID=2983762 RepID=UPI0021E5050D|nr:hypothetical protein [Actinotalea sp. M2MS4P-6]MCV2393712.1 hypothetical protein [Actinotalea sp. M2MS4P-6]
MHVTDWIDVGAELLPRSVKRAIGLALALLLATGVGTPLVRWYVETKSAELAEDLTPVLTRVVDPSAPEIQP